MSNWQLVVLLGTLCIVYAYLLPKKTTDRTQAELTSEMEQTLDHFAQEMEEQNKLLLHHISEMKNKHEIQSASWQGRIESLENQVRELTLITGALPNKTEGEAAVSIPIAISEPSGISDLSAPPDHTSASNNLNMKQRYTDVFQMYDKGKSAEYIAKKVGMNKGEVQLILELAKQEEKLRA